MKTVFSAISTGLLINGVPYAFNSIYVRQVGDSVGLYHQNTRLVLVVEQDFSFYYNGATAFLDVASLITYLQNNAFSGGASISISGAAVTITSSNVAISGTVAAGSKYATLTTSNDFVGSINGLARDASVAWVFNPGLGNTNPAIPYVITGGSINLDITT